MGKWGDKTLQKRSYNYPIYNDPGDPPGGRRGEDDA